MEPVFTYHPNGQVASEHWYKDGQKVYENGIVIQENMFHRLDGPAVSFWYDNGQKEYEGWWVDGIYHREDGPARIFWFENGQINAEEWFNNGKNHRVDGPSYIQWCENGELFLKQWNDNGYLFRIDGPAILKYYHPTKQYQAEWWIIDRHSFSGYDNKTDEVTKWIIDDNIDLDMDFRIVNKNDVMVFRLKFA